MVELERLDYIHQVDLFRQAAAVVAMHGAGLSNLIWTSQRTPPATVVEIMPGDLKKPKLFFEVISELLDLNYKKVKISASHSNVNIEEVIKILEKALPQRR